MHDRKVVLVTGANQGIGLQIAKDLAAKGLTVLLGARSVERGDAAAKEVGSGARALQLDVTDAKSIAAAAEWIRREVGRLDVLVNNAAISHTPSQGETFEEIVKSGKTTSMTIENARVLYETNVIGVIAVTQAMLPLLREAPSGRIVIVGSSVGSMSLMGDPNGPLSHVIGIYSATKAAVNAVALGFARDLGDTRIKVNVACPGFTSTALNKFHGTRSVEEGAREPVRLALLGDDGPTGTFSNEDGPLPW